MIRQFIAGIGQVGAVLVNAALAQPRVRDLRRQVAHEQQAREAVANELALERNAHAEAKAELRAAEARIGVYIASHGCAAPEVDA